MRNLTKQELIILHLDAHNRIPNVFDMPFSVTQDGIGCVLGLSRAHVSLELKKLKDKGLVGSIIAHTPRSFNKRNTYFLLPEGRKKADSLKAVLREKKVNIGELFGEVPGQGDPKLRNPARVKFDICISKALDSYQDGDGKRTIIHLTNAVKMVLFALEVEE